jgi:putative sigma-54 modulation protein
MKFDIKGVHYDITDVTRDFITVKLEKLAYADEHVTELVFTLTKETKDWKAEANCNFRWGAHAHLEETALNLHEAIEKLIDRLDMKISKEKERVQNHKHDIHKG